MWSAKFLDVRQHWLVFTPSCISRATPTSRTLVAIRVTKVFASVCLHGWLSIGKDLEPWRLMMRSTSTKSMTSLSHSGGVVGSVR